MLKKKPEPMWRRYLRFFGPNVAADVNDEVGDHIARLESELRAAGTTDAEIDAAVRARFGDPDALRARLRRADESRLKRSLWIDAFGNFGQDVAYALRRLRQRPGFTAAVVIVLALGVGATTAMFSAVDAAMLRPLPFANPSQLLLINSISVPFDDSRGAPRLQSSHYPDINDLAAMPRTFAQTAAYASGALNLADPQHPLRVQVGVVTSSFFATLGVFPARGRAFTAAEGKDHGPNVAVLSDALWRGHFGGRPMLDSLISLSGTTYTVVGIMPSRFGFPSRSDIWIPLTNPVGDATFTAFRSYIPQYTIARLGDGVDAQTAIDRLRGLWTRALGGADSISATSFRETAAELQKNGYAIPLQRSLVGSRRTALLVLLGATAFLLLIACANVTNLLLSQGATREREISVRAVLGATRARIVRQLLTESVLLALVGTGAGVSLAPLVLKMMSALMPAPLVGLAPPELDWRVLFFAAALALATGIGFGLWPAFGATRTDLAESVKGGGGRGATRGGAGRARRLLVGMELALAVTLLVGAGLMLRSFTRLVAVNSGLNPHRVATLEMSFNEMAGGRVVRLREIQDMLARLKSAPGIEASGVVTDLPLRGGGGIALSIAPAGAPPWRPGDPHRYARYLRASDGYFSAIGIPLLRGRSFTAGDDSIAPKVAIVSRTMADSIWPGQDPIGRQFYFGGNTVPITVVGLVGDVHDYSLDSSPGLQMYLPVYQGPPSDIAVVVRGTLANEALLARLRDVVRAVDPTQAVYRVRMMDDVLSTSVAPQRTNTLLISLFGGLALVLSALGVYAVVAYSVAQRRREFGIRAALGATGRDLITLVSRELVWVMVLGLAVGLGGAWAASRVLASLLFGVTTHDPATFVLAPLALIIPAAIATLIPARRAARTNPVDVIREE